MQRHGCRFGLELPEDASKDQSTAVVAKWRTWVVTKVSSKAQPLACIFRVPDSIGK